MIRCVRIWTGEDQNSHVEEGWIDLKPGAHGDLLSGRIEVTSASLQETDPGRHLCLAHRARAPAGRHPERHPRFQHRGGQHFVLAPGDILLAEDTTGGGHTWRLVDDQPWRRLYVVLGKDAPVPFKRATLADHR
jgi:hypothetical protein